MQDLSSYFELFSTYGKSYLLPLLQIVLILSLGLFFAKRAKRQLQKFLLKLPHADQTFALFLSTALFYSIMILVGVACLGKIGIQTATVTTVIGTAGITIGLALQGTLSNIASGLVIMILRPFRIGEFIETGETSGTVKVIGLFATELQSKDGLFIMTPNSQLWNKSVKNYSRNPNRRAEITIGVSYSDDLLLAKKIILASLGEDAEIITEPLPEVLFDNLGDSSVNLIVKFWIKREIFFPKKSEITEKIKSKLEEQGISIPFPQREIKIIKSIVQD